MLYQNETRSEFKKITDEWLMDREWSVGEMYPFESLDGFIGDIQTVWNPYSVEWIGWERLGETITIGGRWENEGTEFEIHLNPTENQTEFRTQWRWR
jgi:hypothetical protein